MSDVDRDMVWLELQPMGRRLQVASGTPLQQLLFPLGVEFPCGGAGLCGGCRVRVLDGHLAASAQDRIGLETTEIEDGWRLACHAQLHNDVVLELAQWEVSVLSDETAIPVVPRDGLGVAIDIGTTTVVAQVVDRMTGAVLGVESGLNPQAQFGGDIMTRVEYACDPRHHRDLMTLIRRSVYDMITVACDDIGCDMAEIADVVAVGNTVMHHLFAGLPVDALSRFPFESSTLGACALDPAKMEWGGLRVPVRVMPNLGGFVGGDVVAGVLATGLHTKERPSALIDLGTNGEIVVGDRDGLRAAATAAGPAFEGARIEQGMRAATGAISAVRVESGGYVCDVIGGGRPRGICGSGLIAGIAAGLETGAIRASGSLADGGERFELMAPVGLTASDVRQVQLAKGAVAAGLTTLCEQRGVDVSDLETIYVAGAFGNYVSRDAATRIGLLPDCGVPIASVGNTALRGARRLLLDPGQQADCDTVLELTQHVGLNADPRFHDAFVDAMAF